ncbi:MAG: hypothetical protein OEQ81_13180 [Flavobacteriaceae bacterium]|nr:hypothetical protein [Flavobacteriaceae bacterium]
MKRKIVDFHKLNGEVLDLLVAEYPDGYDDDDIISYRNKKGEIVDCVRVNSEDAIYLVKVSKRLVIAMEDHESGEDDIDYKSDLDDGESSMKETANNEDGANDDFEDID